MIVNSTNMFFVCRNVIANVFYLLTVPSDRVVPWIIWESGHLDYTWGKLRTLVSGAFLTALCSMHIALQWRHNDHDCVSNHQPHDCLLNLLFRRGSKKTSKLRVTGLCEGNPPVTGGFPSQRASDTENVSIWWRHHGPGGIPDRIMQYAYRSRHNN